MSNQRIINRLASIEAGALMLLNEATILREELQRSESGNSPTSRKGKLTNEAKAHAVAKFRKNLSKKALQS